MDSTATPPCTLIAKDSSVKVNDTLLSAGLTAGSYCVEVFDVGNIFPGVTVSYKVDVTPPLGWELPAHEPGSGLPPPSS